MPLWSAGAAIVGSLIGADASQSAADTQANASLQAANIAAQQKQPWVDAGKQGLSMLTAGLMGQGQTATVGGQTVTGTGQFTKPFTMADATNSVAQQQAQQQALQAGQQSAAAKGGLLSTGTLEGLQQNAGAIGAQYQNQAFNQWLAQNNQQFNQLASLAQTGQVASSQTADALSGGILAAGQANAAGQVGVANAITGGINQYTQMSTLQKLLNPGGGTGGSPIDMTGFQSQYQAPTYSMGSVMNQGAAGSAVNQMLPAEFQI